MWNRRREYIAVIANQDIPYLLRDDFTDTVAAGSVNGTLATPTGGARTVTDANSKLSIGSGVANFATGGAGYGNPGMWYPVFARAAGRTVLGRVSFTTIGGDGINFGWDVNQTALANSHGFFIAADAAISAYDNSGVITFATVATGTPYSFAVVMRATGAFYFFKGGAFTNWTLIWPGNALASNQYPCLIGKTATVYTADTIRVPQELILITTPLASDAFTRADGAIGNTGGGGSEETGGSGLAWTAQKGTWTVATNKAACSELADSLGIATVPCGTTNVLVEVVATRTGGTSGLCLRYTDVNNYIKCVHNGTNLQVIEVVSGTPNTLINAAAVYNAAARMIISLSATKIRAYYNNALIGAEATTAVVTGNAHGLFTDDIGATFDGFVVWSKGIGGEYATLDRFLA